jgi:hypothetical protein
MQREQVQVFLAFVYSRRPRDMPGLGASFVEVLVSISTCIHDMSVFIVKWQWNWLLEGAT